MNLYFILYDQVKPFLSFIKSSTSAYLTNLRIKVKNYLDDFSLKKMAL